MEPQTAQKKSIFKNPVTYILIVVVALALIGGYLLLQTFIKETETQGSEYREGLEKDRVTIATLDFGLRFPKTPWTTDALAFTSNVYEGLSTLRKGRVEPALAESWTNPDNLTWRMVLRKGVKFHSGHFLKASDVVYTVDLIKKESAETGDLGYYTAVRIDSVKVIDDSTVELKTVNPDPTLIYWLAQLPILSEEQIKADGLENSVGTGPYTIKELSAEGATLGVNEGYWGPSAKVKTLVYQIFKDDDAARKALDENKVDVAYFLEKKYVDGLNLSSYQVLTAPFSDVAILGFDTSSEKVKDVSTSKNPFKDIRVRKAIYLTLDIPTLLVQSGRSGSPLTQLATADLLGFNPELKRAKVNIEEAKKLMKEAGLESGFEATLLADEAAGAYTTEIKRQLAVLNINVKVDGVPTADLYERTLKGGISFYAISWLPDTLDSTDLLMGFVHTPDQDKGFGGLNPNNFSDKDIDNLLDRASSEFRIEERAKLIRMVHEEVMEKLPFVPTITRQGYFVIREDIAFKPAPFGYIFGIELSGRQKITENAQ